MGTLNLKAWAAALGGLCAVVGVLLSLVSFTGELPHVRMVIERIELASSSDDIVGELRRIEEDYSHVTGIAVLELIDIASNLASDDQNRYEQQLSRLVEEIEEAINGFNEERDALRDDRRAVARKLRNLVRLSDRETMLDALQEIEDEYSHITSYLVIDIIAELEPLDYSEPDEDVPDAVYARIELAANEFDADADGRQEGLAAVAEELGNLSTKLRDSRAGSATDEARVSVQVTVENQSRLPTVLRPVGVLAIYDRNDPKKRGVIVVRTSESYQLQPFSVGAVSFESMKIGALPGPERDLVREGVEKEFLAEFWIEDIHDSVWHAEGKLSRPGNEFRAPERLMSRAREHLKEVLGEG
ncbi:MAG TPA: hypothetical protein VF339_12630 [Gammaproteobacteria bacterium]